MPMVTPLHNPWPNAGNDYGLRGQEGMDAPLSYSTMDEDPPEIEATDYSYEPDHVNKILLPRPLPEGVKPAPDDIMKK